VFDCPIDRLTRAEAVDYCLRAWDGDRRTRIVLTINATLIVKLGWDEGLRAAVEASDLALADGMPLIWLSRWIGPRLPERVAGIDLMAELLQEAHRQRLRAFVRGAREQVG